MVYLFLAPGFEETEAICTLDILRRADIAVKTVAVSDRKIIPSSRNVPVRADALLAEVIETVPDCVVLPGGMPGVNNLNIPQVHRIVLGCYHSGGIAAAICAGPSILGGIGLLRGKNAVCYPGFESKLVGARISAEPVVEDDRILTAIGMGATLSFALRLVEMLKDKETAQKIKESVFA